MIIGRLKKIDERCCEKSVFGVPTRFDTNQAVQSHVQMARDLEFSF